MTTNPSAKYKAAIRWCDAHKNRLHTAAKYRLMGLETLYLMLEGLGVVWIASAAEWRGVDKTLPDDSNRSLQRVSTDSVSGRTLIRIIAHSTLIGARVAELTELCEALNWKVIKVSDPVGDNGVMFLRVYVTIDVPENRD